MKYSLDPSSANCYEGTACLINKLDIRDEQKLMEAELYNDLNRIHPFREGNGRVQRIYFAQLIRYYGYEINLSEIDTDELMMATIQASMGVLDGLILFFQNAIIDPQEIS